MTELLGSPAVKEMLNEAILKLQTQGTGGKLLRIYGTFLVENYEGSILEAEPECQLRVSVVQAFRANLLPTPFAGCKGEPLNCRYTSGLEVSQLISTWRLFMQSYITHRQQPHYTCICMRYLSDVGTKTGILAFQISRPILAQEIMAGTFALVPGDRDLVAMLLDVCTGILEFSSLSTYLQN